MRVIDVVRAPRTYACPRCCLVVVGLIEIVVCAGLTERAPSYVCDECLAALDAEAVIDLGLTIERTGNVRGVIDIAPAVRRRTA